MHFRHFGQENFFPDFGREIPPDQSDDANDFEKDEMSVSLVEGRHELKASLFLQHVIGTGHHGPEAADGRYADLVFGIEREGNEA